jgi:hypothetical protein
LQDHPFLNYILSFHNRFQQMSADKPLSNRRGFLHFSAQYVGKIRFEQEKTELWNKQHLVENNTQIVHHGSEMQYISLLPKHIKWISWGVSLSVFIFGYEGI